MRKSLQLLISSLDFTKFLLHPLTKKKLPCAHLGVVFNTLVAALVCSTVLKACSAWWTGWLLTLTMYKGTLTIFLVFSALPEEHDAHLRQLFQKLHDAGLKINLKKTVLGRAEVKFCGNLISDDGIRPPPEKLDAIKNYPKPTTVKGLNIFWVQ